jgi:hypothetical protein
MNECKYVYVKIYDIFKNLLLYYLVVSSPEEPYRPSGVTFPHSAEVLPTYTRPFRVCDMYLFTNKPNSDPCTQYINTVKYVNMWVH